MAYTPINWQTGDTITAEKLNKMDPGWGVNVGTRTLMLDETVTTEGEGPAFGTLVYSGLIDAQSIIVTFNNVEYECTYNPNVDGYGDSNFEVYPFVIDRYNDENELITATAGTYSLKIETGGATTIEVSSDFIKAAFFHAIVGVTTYQEVEDAIASGRIVLIPAFGSYGASYSIVFGTDRTETPVKVFYLVVNIAGVTKETLVAASANSPIQYV